ncbi:MAG: GGDEF domain-containing protein, partial [Pseudomonadota bacterium]
HWHALRVRPIAGPDGQIIAGGMGLLRSIERLRSLENELNLSSTTDPLTGLDNQQSFLAQLERVAACESPSVVMLFEFDSFRALQLQYGRAAADEVLWAFARFLKTMTPEERLLARLQGERFGAVLADCSIEQARTWGEEVRSIFAGLAVTQSGRQPQVSINIGLAHCGGSADQSLQHAELALLLARSKGRSGGCVADHNPLRAAPNLGAMTSSR